MKPLDRIESASDLRSLVEGDTLHRVSLYVRVGRAPTELPASELRLRGAVERAEARLRERGVRDEDIAARHERLEHVPGPGDLDHTAQCLALFGDEAGWAWASLSEEIAPRVVVSPHYALRPLLRVLASDRRFRVLAVSANRVAAFGGDARALHPVPVEGLPGSLEDALGSEVEGRALQYHPDRPVPGRRAQAPVYHGHGGADDERARDRERFHRVLAAALEAAWGASPVPVVLAAEVRTASELREAVDLPALVPGEVSGNPDETKLEELHARAFAVVREAAAARERELAQAFERARNQGKALDRELAKVAEAAIAGRVRRLWVEEEARAPGRIDPMTARHVESNDPDDDALDALVAHVLRRGGEVHVVAEGGVPSGGAYCVELR